MLGRAHGSWLQNSCRGHAQGETERHDKGTSVVAWDALPLGPLLLPPAQPG